jgi:glycosyltransferase involved in cell wall biosynthesis
VDHVLGFGPAAQRHFDQPITIVGSPVIERALEKVRGRRRAGRYVLVSFKANPGDLDARRALDAVSEACRQLGLPLKISVHPTKAAKLDLPGTSSADFSDLLPEALALVSRPSTTIYEAIACGIPVVLFPLVEPLVEFAEPLGAFRLTKVEDLVPNIRDAVASRENFAEQGRAFLEANLSIEPDRPAWRRLAEALIEIYERKAG